MDFGLSLSQFKQVSDDLCTPGTEIHVYVMERIVREGLVKGPNAAWDQSFLWDMECPGYFRNLYEKFYENKIDNFDWLFEELNISLQPDTGTSRVYAKPSTVRVNQKMLMGENLQQTDLCGNILFPNKNLGLEVSQNLNYLPTPFSSKNSADVANCTYGQDYKMELTRAENFAIHEHEEKPFRCYCAKSFTFLDSWR
ncbi:expressed protein [Phakopsora pachyrhizi]|uniref:Expressed protein n=1 Tax=Phakopsora pachyrhizi TaxID=170000 RepID=A0AAV0BA87_PHAPC|nr:expressed protein [Phakopsora pachyrhizi]